MKYIAEQVFRLNSSPAPDEWRAIPEIKEARPRIKLDGTANGTNGISLQRFDDTNLCCWYIRRGVYSNPIGDIFIVTPDEQPEQVNQPADIPKVVWDAAKEIEAIGQFPGLSDTPDVEWVASTIWSHVKNAAVWRKQ